MGEVPDWYVTIQAARYLKVPPWDLVDQPIFWQRAAYAAMDAENQNSQRKDKKRAHGG